MRICETGSGSSSRIHLILIASCAVLVAPGPGAYATEAPESAKSENQIVVDNPKKRICKRVSVTGTHFKQRVCLKRSEWDEMRRQAQDTMREVQTGISPSGGEN